MSTGDHNPMNPADGRFYETHAHTRFCRHAVDEQADYARAAQRIGLDGIVFTCHNPLPEGHSAWMRMRPEELPEYVASVFATRKHFDRVVDVRLGLECDYVPEYRDFLAKQIASAPFDLVLGSLHPQFKEYQERAPASDAVGQQRTYFKLLAESAESGLFDSIAHPDLIKNQTAEQWLPERIMNDVRSSLDRIARTGVAMEVNTSGLQKSVPEMNPFPQMLREMAQRGIPVTLGADAHEARRVGADFPAALEMIAAAGYDHVSMFKERRRLAVRVKDFRQRLLDHGNARRHESDCDRSRTSGSSSA